MRSKIPLLLIAAILAIAFLVNSPADFSTEMEDRSLYSMLANIQDSSHDTASTVCCRVLIDSIRKESARFKYRNRSFFLHAGIVEYPTQYPDHLPDRLTDHSQTHHYFAIAGYDINHLSSFVIRDGHYYVEHTASDDHSIKTLSPIGVRYLPNNYYAAKGGNNKGAVLIPISLSSYRILNTLGHLLMIAGIAYMIWVLIVLPIQVLISIGRGQPFTKRTVRHLFIIGWTLVGMVLLSLLIALIAGLLFHAAIPDEFYFSYQQFLVDSRGMLLTGLIVLLLASAFRKGLELKEHHDQII